MCTCACVCVRVCVRVQDIDAMRAQLQDASDTLPVDQAVINMPEDLYKGRK